MCPMIQYSPAGVSAGIKMSDATLHDAYTPTARKADAMKLICLSREIVRLDSRLEELGTRIPECLRLVG